MPQVTADNLIIAASAWLAITSARVVLPVPGGPHKISENTRPASMAFFSALPSPIKCCWPAYSARLRGRIRAANGRKSSAKSNGNEFTLLIAAVDRQYRCRPAVQSETAHRPAQYLTAPG